MTAEFASFSNRGEYFSAHYFAERLPEDLRKGIFATWSVRENDDIELHQTPREALRALRSGYLTEAVRTFFAERAGQAAASDGLVPYTYGEPDWSERLRNWHGKLLRALGYEPPGHELIVHRSGRDHTVHVAYAGHGIIAIDCGWAKDNDEALSKDGPGRLLYPVKISGAEGYETGGALASWLFHSQIGGPDGQPPRFVLLLTGGVIILGDRNTWGEGRFLAANLDGALERNDRRQSGELATIAALFSLDMLRPGENGEGPAIDALLKASSDNAVGVDGDLREGLQRSVELIASEVLARLEQARVEPAQIEDPTVRFAKELTREALRYLYRILFLLYAEARPELGILPADDDTYEAGYSVARLRELVARDEQLTEGDSAVGFHLHESLDLLFTKVNKGHREYGTEEFDDQPGDDEETRKFKAQQRSEDRGLRFEPLRSALFEPSAIRLIGRSVADPRSDDDEDPPSLDLRLRNATLHGVLRKLTMKKAKRGERGGFISYRNLGINQLGAVYEGLMSYTGFIATTKLYEVAKNGNLKDGSWLVPEDRIGQYSDNVFVQYDENDNRRGFRGRKKYDVGSFVYRLAGRDRETSASYYTPLSLTKATVQLALEHRLDQERDSSGAVVKTRAADLLKYKICEPALGSGAFLNEAINQVAAEYLRRRQEELSGHSIPTANALTELQRVKAYIALHNAYGVDLNATGVELAEVSLWLNTMHPGMRAPWFGLHLRRGNSLIGGRRAIYTSAEILDKAKAWLKPKDTLAPTELPFLRNGEFQGLPNDAVHQFLLPTPGWAPVTAKAEAKSLAPAQSVQLAAWRKGILKQPATKAPRGRLSELQRLQAVARRAEFLWTLVVKRMEISEREVARRIDVWGADPDDQEFGFIHRPENPIPKEKVFRDLFESKGTPYWRLKTVMNTWCALWFWPADKAGLLDGTDPAFLEDSEANAVLTKLPQIGEPISAQVPEVFRFSEQTALFAAANEQKDLFAFDDEEPIIERVAIGRKHAKTPKTSPPERRPKIALRDFTDWLDFTESVLGTYDIPPDSMVLTDPTLDELEEYEEDLPRWMGMDSEFDLQNRFPWLLTAESLAEEHGFLHWELDFAIIFARQGGFDLQVGNPPWVRPRWDEPAVLAEYDPWFGLTEKFPPDQKAQRRDAVLEIPGAREYLLHERTVNAGLVSFLGSPMTYPLLVGTQPDLYRAFMSRAWANARADGMAGLIHPDTHFTGDNEATLRESAYRRLRVHGDFVNPGHRFFPEPVGESSHFGVHVYGSIGEIEFDHMSWLFGVNVLLQSFRHDGSGDPPGVRYKGKLDERPHRARVIHIDLDVLREWHRLTGDHDQPAEQAKLLSPVSTAEADAIQALARYPLRLGQFEPQISRGFDEAGAKASGLIDYAFTEPDGWPQVILKGPQLGVATPLFKGPNPGSNDVLGLNLMTAPSNAVPASEYRCVSTRERFDNAQDLWIDHQRLDQLMGSPPAQAQARTEVAAQRMVTETEVDEAEVRQFLVTCSMRRYTEFYRLAWRRQIAPDTERSLYAAIIPPGPSHIHAVHSLTMPDNRETALTAGFWASIPLDYFLRITGEGDLQISGAKGLPAGSSSHPLAPGLLLRALRMNCLTSAYSSLWEELFDPAWEEESWALPWPGLPLLNAVSLAWERVTPLRSERARRSALVEIDALVAVWLGVDADALIAMYRARFPVLGRFEETTWFDAKGWKLAGNHRTHGQIQVKEHYGQLLTYLDSPDTALVPSGYTPPFYKADREAEMRSAHAVFKARLDAAIARREWDPVKQEVVER